MSEFKVPRSIWEEGDAVAVLDQTLLPHRRATAHLTTLAEAAHAIRSMQVRGAPLIGVTAAYGVALAMGRDPSDGGLAAACATLAATRPTAVNLHWALERMRRVLAPLAETERTAAAWTEARAIAAEDEAANRAIGRHGLELITALAAEKRRALTIATHCNAGSLATVTRGTALAPIYAAAEAGIAVHVLVSETRPRNQGLLTAWELGEAGVPFTLIVDNAAGHLMARGGVDLVMVGADRIAANGDTANKVGTYLKALAARAHGVPFYVVAPSTTIDWQCLAGTAIPIEERAAEEVRTVCGLAPDGTPARVAIAPEVVAAANPAFDVTPAALISAIVCERGVAPPGELGRLFPEQPIPTPPLPLKGRESAA
ncbi:MAG: S-methyl-5-thioribose-1-phosphate isomerase [Pseudomonadota bacterium]